MFTNNSLLVKQTDEELVTGHLTGVVINTNVIGETPDSQIGVTTMIQPEHDFLAVYFAEIGLKGIETIEVERSI